MEQLYNVWHATESGWYIGELMSKEQAEVYAENLKAAGHKVRIQPRLRITLDDIVE